MDNLKENHLTQFEMKAKKVLEHNGWHVHKPSYPDFIVYKDTGEWAFVEVKKRRHGDPGITCTCEYPHDASVSHNQSETFTLIARLGVPVAIFYARDTHVYSFFQDSDRYTWHPFNAEIYRDDTTCDTIDDLEARIDSTPHGFQGIKIRQREDASNLREFAEVRGSFDGRNITSFGGQ